MTDQAPPRNDKLRNWIGSGLVVLMFCFPFCLHGLMTKARVGARPGASAADELQTTLMNMMWAVLGHEELIYSAHGNELATQAQLNTVKTAIIQYKTLNRQLPSNEQGLWALVQPPENVRVKKALMSDSAILDPWGNPYRYRNPGKVPPRAFDVWSLGPDGMDGTADDIFPD